MSKKLKKNTTVIVTGAGGSAAQNFIHSLEISRTKHTTIGVDINQYHLSLSKADFKYVVPPISKPRKYISAINSIIKKHQVDLLHPQPDIEVAFLANNRHKFNTTTFLPDTKTVNLCHHKDQAIDKLSSADVPTAESYTINNSRQLSVAFKKLRKNYKQLWIRAIKGAGSKAALPIKDLKTAKFWINYWQDNKGIGYGDFMLSEYLPGKEYAFQSLWHNGELIVSQARQRLEYVFGNLTLSGQSSSPAVAVTVHNRKVNQVATKAVQAIDPNATGVYCIDLKENKKGTPCIIEINPGRFFTTNNFFSTAGCNMPDYYVRLALGKRLPKLSEYNALKPNLYWLRTIDMGYRLIEGDWPIDGNYQ